MTLASPISADILEYGFKGASLWELHWYDCWLSWMNASEVEGESDVQNAYLTAPDKEKIWTTLGLNFGEDEDKKALIVRALYALKSAGASFNRQAHFKLYKADRLPTLLLTFSSSQMWGQNVGMMYYVYHILLHGDDCLDAESASCNQEIGQATSSQPNADEETC